MKTRLLALLTLLLTVVCAWQWGVWHAAKKQLSETKQALEVEMQAREEQARKTTALERQQSELKEEISSLSSLVAGFRAADAKYASNFALLTRKTTEATAVEQKEPTPEPTGGFFGKGMSGMLSKMMKDPAMKDMMRAQQKLMYGGLAKDLNLTPDQDKKLTELLLDQQMQAVDHAPSLFSKDGETSATNLLTAFADQQKQSEENIKGLLGEEKFGQYQDYQKTLAERMQINLFKQQLEDGESPLRDEQVKQLMSAIREERDRNPPAISPDLKPDANFEKMLSGDVMEKQMQWQEEMNQRVLERAGQILTPEQLKAYSDFQKQQLAMQRLGAKMAREMFGSKDEAGEVKAPSAPAR